MRPGGGEACCNRGTFKVALFVDQDSFDLANRLAKSPRRPGIIGLVGAPVEETSRTLKLPGGYPELVWGLLGSVGVCWGLRLRHCQNSG